jgi:DNA-binding NarL/FixJ family response regulator
MTRPVALMIVTDNLLFGECLASRLLECEYFSVLDVVQTAEEAFMRIQERQPEVVLIDVHLPGAIALTFTKQLTQAMPHVRVLPLGVTEAGAELREYIEAGASGYVTKDTTFHELKMAIELVAQGETMCSSHIAQAMFARLSELAQTSDKDTSGDSIPLSARELEILQLMEWNNRQIADHLYLSLHTVKNHVHNILKKLRVQRRLEAIKYASERRWLEEKFQWK